MSRASLMNLAVTARGATIEPSIGGEIQIWEDAVSRIETPNVHLGSGWQLDLATSGQYLDAQ